MYKFGKTSQDRLNTCHPDLIKLMETAIKGSPLDFSIICGYRNKEDQDRAFRDGKSELKYPAGKHNKIPSLAVDIAPYPTDWDDTKKFKEISKHIKKVARDLDISLWWGGDWSRLKDYPHYELLSWEGNVRND